MDFTILMVVLLLGIGIPTRNKAIRAYRQERIERIEKMINEKRLSVFEADNLLCL